MSKKISGMTVLAGAGAVATDEVEVARSSSSTSYRMALSALALYVRTFAGGAIAATTAAFSGALTGTTAVFSGALDVATITQDAWTAPTLLASWTNLGGGHQIAGFFKDRSGIVHLRGTIHNGTATGGTVLFTLPAGSRPTATEIQPCITNDVLGSIKVTTTGDVSLNVAGSATYVSLNGIRFSTL